MIAIKTPAPYSFVKNPIVFEFTTDSGDMVSVQITCGTSVFTISAYPFKIDATTWKFGFDISDLLSDKISFSPDLTLTNQVDIAGFVKEYSILVGTNYSATSVNLVSITTLPDPRAYEDISGVMVGIKAYNAADNKIYSIIDAGGPDWDAGTAPSLDVIYIFNGIQYKWNGTGLEIIDFLFTGKIIPGGLSTDYRSFLLKEGLTAFQYRFLNKYANFLLTTRSDAEVLTIARNELVPVYFLNPSSDSIISISTDLGDTFTFASMAQGIACMANLPLLLAGWIESGQVSTLYFNVDGDNYLKIKITDPAAEESCLLKFKNSLGVYEQLEVYGIAKRSLPSNSLEAFNTFNADLQEFQENKLREKKASSITMECGHKSTSDLLFISDLLASDDVTYINGIDVQKCIVTSDNFSIDMIQRTPESILLKIKFVNSSENYSPYKAYNSNFILRDAITGEPVLDEEGNIIYAL